MRHNEKWKEMKGLTAIIQHAIFGVKTERNVYCSQMIALVLRPSKPKYSGRLLGRLVAADLPGKIHCSRSCAHVQNYVNNGHLPGKSAATQRWKVSYCPRCLSEVSGLHFIKYKFFWIVDNQELRGQFLQIQK